MTVTNLDNDRTYHFKNLPGFTTVWTMVNGELVGKVYRADGSLTGVVTFPISK